MSKARRRMLAKEKEGDSPFSGSTALACLVWVAIALIAIHSCSNKTGEQKTSQATVEAAVGR
ncbi:MAG: hypothetical protein WCT33_04500 [Patescibacteria group bacterium]